MGRVVVAQREAEFHEERLRQVESICHALTGPDGDLRFSYSRRVFQFDVPHVPKNQKVRVVA